MSQLSAVVRASPNSQFQAEAIREVPPVEHLPRRVLPSMVAHGLGLEALCLYLSLGRAALLQLIVDLDLPTPHDRPLRKLGGRNPWSFADTALFVVLWMACWHVESLGERFGRSKGSIWSKARRLGLPRRDRKLVFRPPRPRGHLVGHTDCKNVEDAPATGAGCTRPQHATPAAAVCAVHAATAETPPAAGPDVALGGSFLPGTSIEIVPEVGKGVPTSDASLAPPYPTPTGMDLFGPMPVGLPPGRKPRRKQVEWTRERDRELARRWWARQHYKAIARDMGLTPSAVQSRAGRLELPTLRDLPDLFLLRREELVDHFDPSVVNAHIAAADYVERKCATFAEGGKVFWFWARRCGNRSSEESRRLAKRRTAWFRPLPPPVRPCLAPLHAG